MSYQSAEKAERRKKKGSGSFPPIPEKIYFGISEAGKLCKLEPHVLRYWEKEFPQLAPVKRRGNRRYYQRKDILLIRKIRHLLYVEGYTINGARQHLTALLAEKHSQQKVEQLIANTIAELEQLVDVLS